jgi:hypothetical protein
MVEHFKKLGDGQPYRDAVELQYRVLKLAKERNALTNQVKSLRRQLEARKDYVFYDLYFWRNGEQRPYCPACLEIDSKDVPLTYTCKNRF